MRSTLRTMPRVCRSCGEGKPDAAFLSSGAEQCVSCAGRQAGLRMAKVRESRMRYLSDPWDLLDPPEKAARSDDPETDARHPKADQTQVAANNRRARDLGLRADLTTGQWIYIKRSQRFRCIYCRKRPRLLVIDHILPLSLGGGTTVSNIQGLCAYCNLRKACALVQDHRRNQTALLKRPPAPCPRPDLPLDHDPAELRRASTATANR